MTEFLIKTRFVPFAPVAIPIPCLVIGRSVTLIWEFKAERKMFIFQNKEIYSRRRQLALLLSNVLTFGARGSYCLEHSCTFACVIADCPPQYDGERIFSSLKTKLFENGFDMQWRFWKRRRFRFECGRAKTKVLKNTDVMNTIMRSKRANVSMFCLLGFQLNCSSQTKYILFTTNLQATRQQDVQNCMSWDWLFESRLNL